MKSLIFIHPWCLHRFFQILFGTRESSSRRIPLASLRLKVPSLLMRHLSWSCPPVTKIFLCSNILISASSFVFKASFSSALFFESRSHRLGKPTFKASSNNPSYNRIIELCNKWDRRVNCQSQMQAGLKHQQVTVKDPNFARELVTMDGWYLSSSDCGFILMQFEVPLIENKQCLSIKIPS